MTSLATTQHQAIARRAFQLTAGATAVGMAIYQVATPGGPGASYDSALDWVRELLFLAYLLASIGAVIGAYRTGLAPRAAAWLVTVGYGAIAAGVLVGMVLRDDPDWFMLLGAPGNLLGAAGLVAWAVWAFRHRVLPGFAALLCGVGGLSAVLFAEVGTSVLIGAFWLYLAFRDGNEA
jgi:hypothetical protein